MFLAIALIVITCFISYRGLTNEAFMERYSFNVFKVREGTEYHRLISSGFLHISWLHLIINMIVLYAFGTGLESIIGSVRLGFIYFASLIGGNLFALWIHSENPRYSSVGASGAVSGLVFALIALFPQNRIGFFLLPISIPSWIYGVLYVLYTVYAIRSRKTDVGHAAHLGGALIGMAVALFCYPETIVENWLPVLLIILPAVTLILIMIYRPHFLTLDKKTQKRHLTYEDRYNLNQRDRKQEVDRILEKINERGMNSLSKKERTLLEEFSKQ